jgi:histone H2A
MPPAAKASTDKKKNVSKSQRVGLTFPVARIGRYVKAKATGKRVSQTAPIHITAVIETIVSDVLELAGGITKDQKRKVTTAEDVSRAIRNDAAGHATLFAGHKLSLSSKPCKVAEALVPGPRRVKVSAVDDANAAIVAS